MSFLYPLALWGLLTPLAIYLIHIRRQQARDVREVSSLILWETQRTALRSERNVELPPLNLLMACQMLTSVALSLAVARPFIPGYEKLGRHVAVILDCSASMLATTGSGRTRIDLAKRRIARLIEDKRPDDRMLLIRAARSATIWRKFTPRQRELLAALSGLEAAHTTTNLQAALDLALAEMKSVSGPGEIHLLTDQGQEELDAIALSGSPLKYSLHYHNTFARGPADNLAITWLGTYQDSYCSQDDVRAYVRVQSFAARPRTARLRVRQAAADLLDEHLALAPGAQRQFELRGLRPGLLEAHLEAADQLSIDNAAHAFVAKSGRARLLVVSADPALKRELSKLGAFEIRSATPQGDLVEQLRQCDIALFDRAVPTHWQTLQANSLIVVGGSSILSTGEASMEAASVVRVSEHPVTADCAEVYDAPFPDAVPLRAHGSLTPVVWARRPSSDAEFAIVAVGHLGNGCRVACLGFAPGEYDLSRAANLQVLLLTMSSLDWLDPRTDAALEVQPGQSFPHRLPGSSVVLACPDGKTTEIQGEFVPPHLTERVGLYSLTDETGARRAFVVNLFDDAESDLRGSRASSVRGPDVAAPESTVKVRLDLWPYAAALCVLLLVCEFVLCVRRPGL